MQTANGFSPSVSATSASGAPLGDNALRCRLGLVRQIHSDGMFFSHGVRGATHAYMHQIAIYLYHRHMLFLRCIRSIGDKLLHFSPQHTTGTPALWIIPIRFPQWLHTKNFCSLLIDTHSFYARVISIISQLSI